AEVELAPARAFPEELHVETFGKALRLREQFVSRRLLKTEQHAACLYLASPAMETLDLKGGRRLGEHSADLQLALLFVQQVHVNILRGAGFSAGVRESCAGC